MPEMTFTVRWPDGGLDVCYSPSLVIHDHLEVGATYTVQEFTSRAALALEIASDRVREKFGWACTSAAATTDQIQVRAAGFAPGAKVEVVGMTPPLPAVQESR